MVFHVWNGVIRHLYTLQSDYPNKYSNYMTQHTNLAFLSVLPFLLFLPVPFDHLF